MTKNVKRIINNKPAAAENGSKRSAHHNMVKNISTTIFTIHRKTSPPTPSKAIPYNNISIMMPKAAAIIFLQLIYGSINALAAPSFRGGHNQSNIDNNNNNRILVECSTHRKKPDCNSDDACSWNQSLRTCDVSPATPPPVVTLSPSRSPIVSPVTPFPTISPTHGPSKSPQIAGMGHCSDNVSMQCSTTDECACAVIGGVVVPPFGGDRKLIECDPNATKRNECNNIGSGCDWIDKQCVPTATITSSPTVLVCFCLFFVCCVRI